MSVSPFSWQEELRRIRLDAGDNKSSDDGDVGYLAETTANKDVRSCDTCRRRSIKCPSADTDLWPCIYCMKYKLECVPSTRVESLRTPLKGDLKGVDMQSVRPTLSYDRDGVDLNTTDYLDKSSLPMMFILHSILVPYARRRPNEHGEVLDDKGGVIGRVKISRSSSLTSQILSFPDSNPNITRSESLANGPKGSLSSAGADKVGATTLPYRNVLEGDSDKLEGREPDKFGDVFDKYGVFIGRVGVVRGLVLFIQPQNPIDTKQAGDKGRSDKLPPRKPHKQKATKTPQCWDHGCNGRDFTTSSSLLRHQLEKDGTSTKEACPRCGDTFTRTTALQGHLIYNRCKFSQTNSAYNQNDPNAWRKAEIALDQMVASWSTPNESLQMDIQPHIQGYDETSDTNYRFLPPDTEGQAPSQSHGAAALDHASARTPIHVNHPKKPSPSSSTFRSATWTLSKSSAPAEAIAKAEEAKTNARYEIAKADESMADSRVDAVGDFARAGKRIKKYGNSGARSQKSSPYSKEFRPSQKYGYDSPKEESPKEDPPTGGSPEYDGPDQIKGKIVKSSSNRMRAPKLPTRPRGTYNIPSAAHKMQSEFQQANESGQPSRNNCLNFAKFLAQPSSRARKITMYGQWLKEHATEPPVAIWQNNFSVSLPRYDNITVSDKAKAYVERFSGQEWDWWPASPPKRTIEPNKLRIQWQCNCGYKRYADCSPALVRKCVRVGELALEGGHRKHEHSEAEGSEHTKTNTKAPTKDHQSTGKGESSQASANTAPSNAGTSGQDRAGNALQSGSCRPDSPNDCHPEFFILLGIKQNSRIDHTQLQTSRSTYNDSRFFNDFRDQYRSLRGFFRYWLSPFIFSHCSFVKYTRFYINELAHVGLNLPVDPAYVYAPRPPGPHEDPPISAHEFNRRFYTALCNPCGRSEAVTRIPKRSQRFQTNLHVDGREDMWGLHVELCPSFFRVLLWQIAVTAGGWALMAWWLVHHKNDLQGASVPVTIIMTATAALYVPLWERMK